MAVDIDSQSSSQNLSSSYGSFTQSKRSSSEASKVYKHASQLFLTRRLNEAYEVLQPIITPLRNADGHHDEEGDAPLAPVATASTSHRIKIWSLYTTLLSNIIDLGSDEGKKDFGSKYWDIVKGVQNGDIWEQVVRDGYRGREDSVDAEVVYNLSNLLLGQGPDQRTNQSRLETYLSSSTFHLDTDLSLQLTRTESYTRRTRLLNGTSTPKDLASRIKILELFTLHVLPRNDEWDYARSFIQNSDILDEERREAFLQTLSELREVKENDGNLEEAEDEIFKDAEDNTFDWRQRAESWDSNALDDNNNNGDPSSLSQSRNSDFDYGVDENSRSNGNTAMTSLSSSTINPQSQNHKSIEDQPLRTLDPTPEPPTSPPKPTPTSTIKPHTKPPISTQLPSNPTPTSVSSPQKPSSSQPPPPPGPSSSSRRTTTNKKPTTSKPRNASSQNAIIKQFRHVYTLVSNLASNFASSLSSNPTILLRFLLFLVAFLMAFSRRDVREKISRVLGVSWVKIRQTVGMGTKVSYI